MGHSTITTIFNADLGEQKKKRVHDFARFLDNPPKETAKNAEEKVPHLNIAPAAGKYVENNGVNTNPKEVAYLTYFMTAMGKTSKGREILTTLSTAGYSVALDYTSQHNGYCSRKTKTLFINPKREGKTPKSAILRTMIHEGEHGMQDVKGHFPGRLYAQDFKSSLMILRFSEAAADLAATEALFHIGGKAWQAEKTPRGSRPLLCVAFEEGYKRTGDLNEARRACVKAWFYGKDSFARKYDLHFAKSFATRLKNGQNVGTDEKSYSLHSIADFYLKTPDGKPLFEDSKKEFADPFYSGITDDMRRGMKKIYAYRQKKFGRPPDRSLQKIPRATDKPIKKIITGKLTRMAAEGKAPPMTQEQFEARRKALLNLKEKTCV